MIQRTDFLARIRANPLCETSRLAYADWLDEHPECPGDSAQAELIRIACQYGRGKSYRTECVNRWLYTYDEERKLGPKELFAHVLALSASDSEILETQRRHLPKPFLGPTRIFPRTARQCRVVITLIWPPPLPTGDPVALNQEIRFGIRLGMFERFQVVSGYVPLIQKVAAAVRADHPLAHRVELVRLLDPKVGTVMDLPPADE